MKILLINPPTENEIIGNNPSIIEDERGYNPPLGLLYVASYLKKSSNHAVEIIDCQVDKIKYDNLENLIIIKQPDLVGITTMTLTLIDVLKTASIAKTVSKKIKVVLGGPHVFLYPDETISHPDIDFLVCGEGEEAFTELCNALENRAALGNIKGLIFKNNGKIIHNEPRSLIDDLDQLPFPARKLTPYHKYSSLLARRLPITTMITSRGCPFGCTFCARPHLGKKFRARSARNIADEMEECISMGINEFLIYDDTFSVKRERVLEICDEILSRKLKIGYDIRARVDCIDREMLIQLKKSGCERIHYGIEAGTEKILKILNKGISRETASHAFALTKKVGISTLAYFMIGAPTETKKDILETISFAKSLNPDYVHFTILIPFPASSLYKSGLDNGSIINDFWKKFAASPNKDFDPPFFNDMLSKDELNNLLSYAYKSFYTRPGYIIKQLFKTRSIGELGRKIHAGLKVLVMK